MKTVNDRLDKTEHTLEDLFYSVIRPFIVFFGKFKKHNRVKTKEVIEEYKELLEMYAKIENRTSGLSFSKRKKVIDRIEFLIAKGHIKAT